MRIFNIILFTIIMQFAFVGCSNSNNLEKVMSMAGNNRRELELVLDHFRYDQFKYDAAEFLIANMETKHYYEGWQIDSLKKIKRNGKLSDDQLAKWNGFDYRSQCKRINHVNVITSHLLIDNIERACDVWKSRPWHNNYSFEEFCEYVLPYCIGDEPLEEWRSVYYDKYSSIIDTILPRTTDVVEVAASIATVLKNEGFNNHSDISLPNLGALYLMDNRIGYCRENCDIATYVMRTLGIPIATDFYITSPSYNSRHFWNAIIDTCGIAVPFNYTENPIMRNSKNERKMGKVYRNMFGEQECKYKNIDTTESPELFLYPYIKDVSEEYFTNNKPIEIKAETNDKFMFLSIYNGHNYEAIDISKIRNGSAHFNNVEQNIIVFPTIYKNGEMYACGYPILTGENKHHVFVPEKNLIDSIVIKRKYPLRNTLKFISNIIGASITVSSDKSFENSATIHEFKDTLQSNNIILNYNSLPVRYLRYKAPSDKNIEIAELHIFDKDNKEVKFKSITANHKLDDLHTRNLSLISDNIWSSFYMSKKGEFLTFDFGKSIKIGKILFVPRNDDNFIRQGHRYELYYHNGLEGWKSVGYKIAESDSIVFKNVPQNALFWIHNYSEGIEERCFYIIDGRQEFI